MTENGDHENELLRGLERDPYFLDWHQADRLLNRTDIDRAIVSVLNSHQGDTELLPGAQERAMRRLALFQIVAPHLGDRPRTWIELFGLLSSDEVTEVEEILGNLSLGELLEDP